MAALSSNARADEVPLATGEHWVKSSDEVKKVHRIGFANLVQVETAYKAANLLPEVQSIVPRVMKGLKGQIRTGSRRTDA